MRCLSALRAHAIDTVVDVRELPLSRKPGFSKWALTQHLVRSGVKYIHLRALGTPRQIRARYRADRDREQFRAAYLQHLGAQAAALDLLCVIATNSKCALLCFEADPNMCHRSWLAAAVAGRVPVTVSHILLDAPP